VTAPYSHRAVPAFRLTWAQQLFLLFYQLAWHLGLPLVMLYFWWRGRKEPLYRAFFTERFGHIRISLQSPIWLHSASLGELRGVIPLIDRLLAEGLPLMVTTLTPAGRNAANQRFAAAIAAGQMQVSYLPLELPWAVRAFARNVRARCMISTEIDTWPVLLHTLKHMGLPLAFVNAQYPKKSFDKDRGWPRFRAAFFCAYDMVLCKSTLHAQRFLVAGCPRVEVVGELRFELPIPPAHLSAAQALLANFPGDLRQRGVLCVASVVQGEDDWILDAYAELSQRMRNLGRTAPFLVYVPRSPQRFDTVAQIIVGRGLKLVRRSTLLDVQLCANDLTAAGQADVLLGDSLGEMYFYQALADIVTVCGSFIPGGSHNVIEPLALHKPVIVGPSIWGIEYPGQEALADSVLTQVMDAKDLPARWLAWFTQPHPEAQAKARQFMAEHSGSVDKHWHHLKTWLPKA
jgi:3-deoxy-D-manno-octulosonic-acid transferase